MRPWGPRCLTGKIEQPGSRCKLYSWSELWLRQKEDSIRDLLYRLLGYRIIHSAGSAITHKSAPGTFHAFVIDIGCYAHMRKLQGRFTEIDLSQNQAKERMRSAPILGDEQFSELWEAAPADAETALLADE